jgi:hypothetical protein
MNCRKVSTVETLVDRLRRSATIFKSAMYYIGFHQWLQTGGITG